MPKPSPKAWYGWQPELPDFRDLPYTLKMQRTKKIPAGVDLRPGFPPCYDQGDLGSCTANAISGLLEFLMRKQNEKDLFTPSRLFIYYNERSIEGTIGEDAGAMIRNGIKSVNQLGAPHEELCPYMEGRFKTKPSSRAYADAMLHQSLKYHRVDHTKLKLLKSALASGFPVVFGFSVYDAFESEEVEKTGILNLPAKGEKQAGGHAVVCVGYDDKTERVLVRNSWGTDWGQNGYFTMPYEYVSNPDLADDFWTITLVE